MGFDLGRARLQIIVELIPGPLLGATRAPSLPIDFYQPYFVVRLIPRSAADLRRTADEGQFVIFLKKNHHAVGELNPLGHLWMKTVQCRRLNLFPVIHLTQGGRAGQQAENTAQCDQRESAVHHLASFPVAGPFASWVDSIIPVVRLDSTKVALATRRISALLTLSISSTCRNSCLQSPYRDWALPN